MKRAVFVSAVIFCALQLSSQSRIPMLGETAPAFKANTTNGDFIFPEDFGTHWKILLSHPKDFTPVCTSEIMQLAQMQDEFAALNVKLAIISTDDLESHKQWKLHMEEILQENGASAEIEFPLIEDNMGRISDKYGMLHAWENPTRNVRGVFIINPANEIKSVNFYPMEIGRNMDEILRVVLALQTAEEEQVLIPVNWSQGDDVLMKYVPYTAMELAENPALEEQYYKVGINLWYKKGVNSKTDTVLK